MKFRATKKEMVNQYDAIALCAHVQDGKVKYCKEYSLKGRIVRTEYIPYSEFARLSDQQPKSNNKIMEATK